MKPIHARAGLGFSAMLMLCGCSAFPEFTSRLHPEGVDGTTLIVPLSLVIQTPPAGENAAPAQSIVADTMEQKFRRHFERAQLQLDPNIKVSGDYQLYIKVEDCELGELKSPMAPFIEMFGVLGHKNWIRLRLGVALTDKSGREIWRQTYTSEKKIRWNARVGDDLDIAHKISYEASAADIGDAMLPKVIDAIVKHEEK